MSKEIKLNLSIESVLSFLIVIYFFFYEHIQSLISYNSASVLCVFNIGLALLVVVKNFRLHSGIGIALPWVLVILLSLYRNHILINQMYWISFWNYISAFIVAFSLIKSADFEWFDTLVKTAKFCGLCYVLTTLAMVIIPGLGSIQYTMWGYYPNGTENGTYSYRAGLATNYSANGIYIALTLIIFFISIISDINLKKRIKKSDIFYVTISAAALLFTTKRAHLLFAVSALVICFLLIRKSSAWVKFTKLLGVGVLALLAFSIVSYFVPALMSTFDRFFNESGDISTGRYVLWEYALDEYHKNPILGIGWFGFRFQQLNFTYSAGYYDVHCIYIQLLCEVGIIGLILVVFAMVFSWFKTLILIKKRSEKMPEYCYSALTISLVIQTFMILYGITSNVLYDRCFIIYILSIAVEWSVEYMMRTKQ